LVLDGKFHPYGNAIIEFEKSLSATLEEAKRQLCRVRKTD
jgi:hypothetical protein